MRIAVTGGTGFIGSHVIEILLDKGYEVSCLVFPGEGPGWLAGKPVRFHEGSLLDAKTLGPFLEGSDAIIHLAGLTRARTEAEFMAVNAEGAALLAEAALALLSPPRQLVAMSSLAAVGPSSPDGACLDEEAELRPLTPYGRSKASLEEKLGAYAERLAVTIIRAPAVYGPRDRDFLQYFKLVQKGLRVIIGPRNTLSLVYVKSLADGIVATLFREEARGQAFFLADEGTYDWDDLCSLIETALAKRTLRIRIPEWAVSLAAVGTAIAAPFLRKPPLLTKHKLREMRQPCWIVSTAKAKRLLGWTPRLHTAEAMRETAAWYLAQGWI